MQKNTFLMASILLLVFFGMLSQQKNIRANDGFPLPLPKQLDLTQATSDLNPKLVTSNNKFAFKLYQEILKQDSKKNVFISPSSIALALAMTYNGASGTTQQEMAQVLEILDMTPEEVNQANSSLTAALESADPEVKLSIANSLWSRQGFDFKSQFLETNQKYYDAEVQSLDFTDPASVATINRWVSDNTNGKIEKIIEQLSPQDVMFLINAIYFKGNWQHQFDPAKTREQPFNLANGKTKPHPMMTRQGEYKYHENEAFQAISLPYGEGRLSMYVFLPRGNDLKTFQQQLTPENWDTWLKKFRQREGSISLPRFKLEYNLELNQALQALGMQSLFNESQADLSAMTDNKVVVDAVKHKTFVEVNEEGTEAAAVTSVGVRLTSVGPPPFQMKVDRPFFTAIRDNETGTLLFMGAIHEPK